MPHEYFLLTEEQRDQLIFEGWDIGLGRWNHSRTLLLCDRAGNLPLHPWQADVLRDLRVPVYEAGSPALNELLLSDDWRGDEIVIP